MFYLNKYIFCMCSKYRVIIPTNKKIDIFKLIILNLLFTALATFKMAVDQETDGMKDFCFN